MTAQNLDPFDYEPSSAHTTKEDRRHYWAVAIGLQDVDSLEVSEYARNAANEYIDGEISLREAGDLIRKYHSDVALPERIDNEEADLVAQRIVELLAGAPFALSPEILPKIHRYIFQDLDPSIYHPGEFKTDRMVKQEEILNGDSVLYADPLAYEMSLRGAFDKELGASYGLLEDDELKAFAHFIAFLWQVHPFYEGNTRTIAVFSELYLNQLGFDVRNDPFEKHARYYRDALVRAMYRNAKAGILPDESFLVAFYENAIGRGENALDREELVCSELFDDPSLIRNVDPTKALRLGKSQRDARFDD